MLFNDDPFITKWIHGLAATFHTGAEDVSTGTYYVDPFRDEGDSTGKKKQANCNVQWLWRASKPLVHTGAEDIPPLILRLPGLCEMFQQMLACGYYEGPANRTLSLTAAAPPSVTGHVLRLYCQGWNNAKAAFVKARAHAAKICPPKKPGDKLTHEPDDEFKSNPKADGENNEEDLARMKPLPINTVGAALGVTDMGSDGVPNPKVEKDDPDKTTDEYGNKIKVLTNRDLASFPWLTRLDRADKILPEDNSDKDRCVDPSNMTTVWRIFYQHRLGACYRTMLPHPPPSSQ
jgi:hypothetical protein